MDTNNRKDMKKKTLAGWEKSNVDLNEYLTEPCEIDEELSNYIGGCVVPQYLGWGNGLIQGGDPEKHEIQRTGTPIGYYMTTLHINGKHFYLGILPEFRQ